MFPALTLNKSLLLTRLGHLYLMPSVSEPFEGDVALLSYFYLVERLPRATLQHYLTLEFPWYISSGW